MSQSTSGISRYTYPSREVNQRSQYIPEAVPDPRDPRLYDATDPRDPRDPRYSLVDERTHHRTAQPLSGVQRGYDSEGVRRGGSTDTGQRLSNAVAIPSSAQQHHGDLSSTTLQRPRAQIAQTPASVLNSGSSSTEVKQADWDFQIGCCEWSTFTCSGIPRTR